MVAGVLGEPSRLAARLVEAEKRHNVGCVTTQHLLMEEVTAQERT